LPPVDAGAMLITGPVDQGVSMHRKTALATSLAVAAGVLISGVLATGNAATAATCAGTVQITSFVFNPPVVSPGQPSTAALTAQNCTSEPVQALVTWSARYLGSSAGIPPGCPAIDPVAMGLALPANGQTNATLTYLTFASCTATGLQVTGTIAAAGTTLASGTATLAIGRASPSPSTAAAGCSVTYTRQSEWNGGFVAQVTIANRGGAAINGWALAFTFPGDQTIGNTWNAAVSQSGATVTAPNLAYNRLIAAGGTVSFGFQGSWRASDASPPAFTLNGSACSVG
jgi:hypothetical protein